MTITVDRPIAPPAAEPEVTLRFVVNHIATEVAMAELEQRPARWTQEVWRGPRGFCLGGWAIELHPAYMWRDDSPFDDVVVAAGGRLLAASDAAMEILGLSERDGYALFNPLNTLSDLMLLVRYVEDRDATAAMRASGMLSA